jgi:hypothetical protein
VRFLAMAELTINSSFHGQLQMAKHSYKNAKKDGRKKEAKVWNSEVKRLKEIVERNG